MVICTSFSLELSSDELAFSTFDISKVLQHGTPLLASAGDEFMVTEEGDAELAKMSEKERAMFYRQQLKQKLGLVAQGKVFSTGMYDIGRVSNYIYVTSKHFPGPYLYIVV